MTKRQHSTALQIYTPQKKRESSSSRKLDISRYATSDFTLPDDWYVYEKKRPKGSYTDKYYHEPGTGRKFRSLVSVQRHLTEIEGQEMTHQNVFPRAYSLRGLDYGCKCYGKPRLFMNRFQCKSDNQIVVHKYTPKHQFEINKSQPLRKLPAGWYVKRTVRRSGHSMGRVDKYYCERSTGRVFRSRLDVQRYLADNYVEENTTLSKLFKPAGLIKMSGSEGKDVDYTSAMAIVPLSSYRDSDSEHSDDVLLKDLVTKYDDVPVQDNAPNADDVPLKDLVRMPSDVPLKDFIQKSNGIPPKDFVQNVDDVPLKDLVRKFSDVPLKVFVQKSKDNPPENLQNSDYVQSNGLVKKSSNVPTKDLEHRSANMPVKDLVRNSESVPPKNVPRNSSDARKNNKLKNKLPIPSSNLLNCTESTLPVIEFNPPIKIRWVLDGPGGENWSPFTGDTMVQESMKQEWAKLFMHIVGDECQDGSNSDGLD